MLRNVVTANSRPMMMSTIHAGASSICTSEMRAARISSLSASGSMNCPSGVICLRRRARYPSAQSVSAAIAKIAALTIHTPKPIVPIFNRPFLRYQLDLLKHVPEIDEVILSLNYQPRRIEEMFGDGSDTGMGIRYVVEPAPLGTAGAVRYAGESIRESVVVFNGDVLTQVDLAAVIALHRDRKARATIVLTPVENPSAYGLVETDATGHIQRFLEKPKPDEITCDTINAGIYVLEPETFDRIPKDTPWSIERSFFPSLIERNETFVAYVYRGYWIDIGTPEKYMKVHRDIMDGRFKPRHGSPFNGAPAAWVSPHARVEEGVELTPPCFVDDGTVIKTG